MLSEFLLQAAQQLADPRLLGLSAVGVVLGVSLGCLPGISSTMSLAILLPVSYALDPRAAMAFLIAVFSASVYGGSISAILINIPGTPGAIVTQLDGYPMARAGKAGEALTYALVASTVGGLVGLAILMLVAPVVAGAALQFRSPEFAMATLLGLTMLAYSTPGSTFRGVLSGAIGLLCGMVGFDLITDVGRFDFGAAALQAGIELVPLTVGLFGLAEVMGNVDGARARAHAVSTLGRMMPPLSRLLSLWKTVLRGSTLGALVGAIPAAGSAIAVAVSYAQEQRLSKRPQDFGKGAPEGIAGPEAANNACVGGALIPMMTLGIPGDTMTAVLMGALLIHGLRPGPMLFAERPDFVATIYVALFVALVMTVVVGILFVRQVVKLMRAPSHVLMIVIAMLCVVGSYAIRTSVADVFIMIAFGCIGHAMNLLRIPVAPMAFGLILGPILEENLRRSLIVADGNWAIFVQRPIAATMLALSAAALVYPAVAPLARAGIARLRRGRGRA